jgi:hypothetical protein
MTPVDIKTRCQEIKSDMPSFACITDGNKRDGMQPEWYFSP